MFNSLFFTSGIIFIVIGFFLVAAVTAVVIIGVNKSEKETLPPADIKKEGKL